MLAGMEDNRIADPDEQDGRIARFMGFAALGVLGTVQEMAGLCLGSMEGANPELLAEETLCLVATATSRAAEVGLREDPAVAAAVVPTLAALPFTYRDYLLGTAIVSAGDAELAEARDPIYQRLQRKNAFYNNHLPPGQFPGERVLADAMAFWMGRISPPKMPESPAERLKKLDLMPVLLTHLRLVLAFGRQKPVG
jgi:hypothetical protein